MTKDENELTALARLFNQRFEGMTGKFSAASLLSIMAENGPDKYILHKDKRITVYGLPVPQDVVKRMNPATDGNEFTRVTREDLALIVEANESRKHKPYQDGIVVFDHTHRALRAALKRLSR